MLNEEDGKKGQHRRAVLIMESVATANANAEPIASAEWLAMSENHRRSFDGRECSFTSISCLTPTDEMRSSL